jgi:hypothetical protein
VVSGLSSVVSELSSMVSGLSPVVSGCRLCCLNVIHYICSYCDGKGTSSIVASKKPIEIHSRCIVSNSQIGRNEKKTNHFGDEHNGSSPHRRRSLCCVVNKGGRCAGSCDESESMKRRKSGSVELGNDKPRQ